RPPIRGSSSTHAATSKGAEFLVPDAATIRPRNPRENDDSLLHRQQGSSPPPTALSVPKSPPLAGAPLTSQSQNQYHALMSVLYETVKITGHGVQESAAPWHYVVPPGQYPAPQHYQATLVTHRGTAPSSLPDPSCLQTKPSVPAASLITESYGPSGRCQKLPYPNVHWIQGLDGQSVSAMRLRGRLVNQWLVENTDQLPYVNVRASSYGPYGQPHQNAAVRSSLDQFPNLLTGLQTTR